MYSHDAKEMHSDIFINSDAPLGSFLTHRVFVIYRFFVIRAIIIQRGVSVIPVSPFLVF